MNLPNARTVRQRKLVLNPVEITQRCVAKEVACVGARTIGYFFDVSDAMTAGGTASTSLCGH
jgi:hypothetical protein